MTVTTPTAKCKICGLWNSRQPCTKCNEPVCNIHFCDVCRHCSKHCVCWINPSAVYHPPPNEPPPR